MSRLEPVRIGVAGVGSFGLLHAQTLQGLAEAELVGVMHRRQGRLDEIADELPGVPGWTDLDRAIAESGAEAWVVASSTSVHVPMTRTLLEAGKAVLLEKPLAPTLDVAKQLEPVVNQHPGPLMLGHILLFNSEFRRLVEEVPDHGPVTHLNCVRHRPIRTMELLPDDPLELLMVHDLYATQVLVNRAEPEHLDCRVHRHASGRIDLAVAQLQWPDGCVGTYSASFMTPDGMASDGYDRMEVFGHGWIARLEPNPRPLQLWDDRARWPLALELRPGPVAPAGMMAEELRCFCRVVRGIEPVPMGATYEDALQVQRWLERLRQAVSP